MLRYYGYSLLGAGFGWGIAGLAMTLRGPDALPYLGCRFAIPFTLFAFCRLRGMALIVTSLASLVGAFFGSTTTSQSRLDRFMLLDSDPFTFFLPVTISTLGAFLASVFTLFAFAEDLKAS